MSSCIVQNCRSIWIPNSEIKFHNLPQNEGRKKLWLSILPIKGKVYSSARICSLHFKPSDYNPDRPGHLLPNAVPFYYSIQSCDCRSKVSNTESSESLVEPTKWGSKENLVSNTEPSESLVVPTNRESNENPLLMSLLSSKKALSSPYQVQLPGCSLFDKNVSNTGPSESLVVPTREPNENSLLMSLLSPEKAPPAPYHVQLPGFFDKIVNLDADDESPLSAKRRQRDFNVQVKIKTRREVDLEKGRKVLQQKIHRQQKKINDMQSLLSIVREYTSNTETQNILQGNFANICRAFNKNQNRKRFVHSDELKNLEATDMEICRICLVTDVKMYSLEDESIKICFESIPTLGGKSNIEGLPRYICYECKAILFKSYNLIKKSMISLNTLEDIFAESGQITKHLVRKRNRQHLNLVSPLSYQYVPSHLFEYTYDEDICISNLSNVVNKDDNTHYSNIETTYIDKDEFGENQETDAIYLNIDTDVIEIQVDDDDNLCDETVESENDDIKASFLKEHTEPTSETEFMDDLETQSSDINSKDKSMKSNITYVKMDMISDTDLQKFFNIVEMSLQEQNEEYEKAISKQSDKAVDVEYKCDVCHKIFFTLAACQSHIICHDLKRGAFECLVCKIRFKTDNMLSSHTRDVHQRKYHCKSCPKTLNNAKAARNHLRRHGGYRCACALCPYRTAHAYKLTAHVRRAHAAHMHACTRCGHAFVSERGLKSHTAAVHRDVDEKSDVSDEVYRCDECDINFKTEGAKRVHLLTSQIHIKKKNSQSVPDRRLETTCLRCGEEFPSAMLKHAHVRREHRRRSIKDGKDGYPKLCDYCELVLRSRWEHWTHIRKWHPTERSSYRPIVNVVCDKCGKGCASVSDLRLHALRHRRAAAACPRCPRVFYDRAAVARHLVSHAVAAGAARAHLCATCGRAFTHRPNLLRHAKVHSDEALHGCSICSKKFKHSESLKLHMRTVHDGLPYPPRKRNKKTNVDLSTND